MAAGAAVSRPAPSRFILKQTETDDIEAYLQTFERTAVREKWEPEQWAAYSHRSCQTTTALPEPRRQEVLRVWRAGTHRLDLSES